MLFNDTLQISNKSMEERVLKFTVVDVDRNRRHQVIGHALYPLREHNYNCHEPVVILRDLEKEVAEVGCGRKVGGGYIFWFNVTEVV